MSPILRIGLSTQSIKLSQGLTKLQSISCCQNMLQIIEPNSVGCMLRVNWRVLLYADPVKDLAVTHD